MANVRSDKPPAAGLIFFEKQEKPRQYVIFRSAVIKGRCPMEVFTTSSLQLEYSFLASEQGEIFYDKGKWYYRNLTDEADTFAAGHNVSKGSTAELSDGSVIRLFNDNRMLTAIFLTNYVSARDWRYLNMDDKRHSVTIRGNDIDGREATLSFRFEEGHWTMEELFAEEVLHNGVPVNETARVKIDDCIQIGDTKFFFEGSGLIYGYPPGESSLSIKIDERAAYQMLKKVKLLEDIDLSIEPGNMILILGGSGAGKSTFVNAVTGYEKAQATIKEGDIDYYRDYDQVKHRIGFVPQENLMRPQDTVGSTVRNAAGYCVTVHQCWQ